MIWFLAFRSARGGSSAKKLALGGLLALLIGGLLFLARFVQPDPTCGGATMHAGDRCRHADGSVSSYDDELRSSRKALAIGGGAVAGLGVIFLAAGFVVSGREPEHRPIGGYQHAYAHPLPHLPPPMPPLYAPPAPYTPFGQRSAPAGAPAAYAPFGPGAADPSSPPGPPPPPPPPPTDPAGGVGPPRPAWTSTPHHDLPEVPGPAPEARDADADPGPG